MRITNTYLDDDKDVWWAIDTYVFMVTDGLFQASKSAINNFNSWIISDFTKTRIGTKYD